MSKKSKTRRKEEGSMAKATTNMKQDPSYRSVHAACFAPTQPLLTQVAAFFFEVIAAPPEILALSTKEPLPALKPLTHTTPATPHPVMPLVCPIPADIPAMFRRAAIHAAL